MWKNQVHLHSLSNLQTGDQDDSENSLNESSNMSIAQALSNHFNGSNFHVDKMLLHNNLATVLGVVMVGGNGVIRRCGSMQNFGFNMKRGSVLGWQDIYDVYEPMPEFHVVADPEDDEYEEEEEEEAWRKNIPQDWYVHLLEVS